MAYDLVQENICLFHITHFDNIPAVLKKGLLSKNFIYEKKIKFKDISEDKIQEARAVKKIPGTDYVLHDCVPMFFGARPPMLYAVRFKGVQQEEIVYVMVKWNILRRPDVWFTDGNARTEGTNFYQGADRLTEVDLKAARAYYWGETEDLKRKKQAEILKLKQVLLDEIIAFAVYNETAKSKLAKMLAAQKIDKEILAAKEFYYS